jgi:hypothetical protein
MCHRTNGFTNKVSAVMFFKLLFLKKMAVETVCREPCSGEISLINRNLQGNSSISA